MQRRFLLRLGALTPVALFASQYLGASPSRAFLATAYRDQAQRLNQLAANIRTSADARRLVDYLADLFADEIPHGWLGGPLRSRIAQAEFAAVSDPQRLIPEQRIAAAWNAYVDTIQAPEDNKATSAEIHNLRDAFWTTARLMWERNQGNFWTVPSIYATQPNGALAPGSRAIEAIRVLWDLANEPDNLKGARDRVSKGELASDLFRQELQRPPAMSATRAGVAFRAYTNPIWTAQRQYVQDNGMSAFARAVATMVDRTLA